MKALILNSGIGKRMGEITSEHPKCMTEVSVAETIVSRQLKMLAEYGITDVVMTVGPFREKLESYCRSLNLPITLTFVPNPKYDSTNYIYSIYCAREYLDDDIVLMHGDLVFEALAFEKLLTSNGSCMTTSSTLPLPEKDFKAVLADGHIKQIGIDCFENAVSAQPLYKLTREDWKQWLDKIVEFCEAGTTSCYAENALNAILDRMVIAPCDVADMLCNEIDNVDDLNTVSKRLQEIEERTVYMCFSTDLIHSGHIPIITVDDIGRL